MSGVPQVVIVRAFCLVLDETGGTLKKTAAAFVLVAPNAASLLDRVQACTAPSIRKWVDTART